MRTSVACVFLLAATWSEANAGAGPSSDDVKRRFLAEFPRACERYLAMLEEYQRNSESDAKGLGDGYRLRSVSEARQNGRCGRLIVTPDPSSGEAAQARVVNSRYAFVLRKKPGQDWVLHDFHEITDGIPRSIYYFKLDDLVRSFAPYWLDATTWLPDVMAKPEFAIRNAVEQIDNDRRLIRIDYELKTPNRPETRSGYLVVDPARYWLPTEQEHTSTGKSSLTTKKKYEYLQDGDLPLLSQCITTQTSTRFPGNGVEDTITYRFARESADDSEFTLSAFGLPEPVGMEWKRRTSRYYWILVAGAGFVAVGVVLLWLVRRSRRKAGVAS